MPNKATAVPIPMVENDENMLLGNDPSCLPIYILSQQQSFPFHVAADLFL